MTPRLHFLGSGKSPAGDGPLLLSTQRSQPLRFMKLPVTRNKGAHLLDLLRFYDVALTRPLSSAQNVSGTYEKSPRSLSTTRRRISMEALNT
jgi:hypothetical protein